MSNTETLLLINQAYENMGLRTTQLPGTLFDGMTRHTEEAYRWGGGLRREGVSPDDPGSGPALGGLWREGTPERLIACAVAKEMVKVYP